MNLISDLALLTSKEYVNETLSVDDEVIDKCLLTNTSKNFLQLLSKTIIKLYKSIGFRETYERLGLPELTLRGMLNHVGID
jgi:hypothetical protein